MNNQPGLGCWPSKYDIRTFSFAGKTYDKQSGGKRYAPEDIEDQSKVGICTSISLTQNARKATGIKYSADFQYLLQKKFYDSNSPIGWGEGSSIFHALKVAKNYGLLPEEEWNKSLWRVTQADRDLPYHQYIAKLKAVPEQEIQRLLEIAKDHKIKAYAEVIVDRDSMARAIDESKAGILARFNVGKEWWSKNGVDSWRKEDLEPLRSPQIVVSGHAVTESNYDGRSFRIANSWGREWAHGGTAYHLLYNYSPTECWAVFYFDKELPKEIEKQIDERNSLYGQILNNIQKIIELLKKMRNVLPS